MSLLLIAAFWLTMAELADSLGNRYWGPQA